jgi:hypothetical protein
MSQWEGTYWHVLLLLGILKYRREVIDVLAEPEAVVARNMRRTSKWRVKALEGRQGQGEGAKSKSRKRLQEVQAATRWWSSSYNLPPRLAKHGYSCGS